MKPSIRESMLRTEMERKGTYTFLSQDSETRGQEPGNSLRRLSPWPVLLHRGTRAPGPKASRMETSLAVTTLGGDELSGSSDSSPQLKARLHPKVTHFVTLVTPGRSISILAMRLRKGKRGLTKLTSQR